MKVLAPIVLMADRLAGWFVVVMLFLAAVTVAAWWRISPSQAIDHAAALLIVTCPCGLGLATPLAVTVAIGRAARRGMLIRGGDSIQSLATPGRIFLDKTGTITQGSTELVRWHGPEALKPLIAALEALPGVEHFETRTTLLLDIDVNVSRSQTDRRTDLLNRKSVV